MRLARLPVLALLAFSPGCVTVRGEPRTVIRPDVGGEFGTGLSVAAAGRPEPRADPQPQAEATAKLVRGGLIGSYMDKQAAEMKVILVAPHRVERQQERLTLRLASAALFAGDGSTLPRRARVQLAQVAAVLTHFPRTLVQVSANAENAEVPLVQRQAKNVTEVFLAEGVTPARLRLAGGAVSIVGASQADGPSDGVGQTVQIDIEPDAGLRAQAAEHGY